MASFILLDEIHIDFSAPQDVRDRTCAAIRQTLNGARFRADLRRCLRTILRSYPPPARVRVRVTR